MSWSAQPITNVPQDSVIQSIKDMVVAGVDYPSSQVLEQLDAAKSVAIEIVTSGAVGDEHCNFSVNMNGHANPDHEPTEGWANDYISLTVSQTSRTAPTSVTPDGGLPAAAEAQGAGVDPEPVGQQDAGPEPEGQQAESASTAEATAEEAKEVPYDNTAAGAAVKDGLGISQPQQAEQQHPDNPEETA